MRQRIALQIVALVAATAAHAATLGTPPLHPDPQGKLVCTVVNLGSRSLGITAQIVAGDGQNVTDFAAQQYQDPADQILASVVVESSTDTARWCKITVTGGGRSQVRGSLEAFDANGTRTAVVEAR